MNPKGIYVSPHAESRARERVWLIYLKNRKQKETLCQFLERVALNMYTRGVKTKKNQYVSMGMIFVISPPHLEGLRPVLVTVKTSENFRPNNYYKRVNKHITGRKKIRSKNRNVQIDPAEFL